MADIEKVAKGLCEAIGIIHGYVEKRYWGYGEQACRDALELLKEQQNTIWELQELNEHLNDKLKKSERQKFIVHEDGTIEPVTYQKEQQPKLLTLKETVNAKYPMDVFCEIKGEERIFALTAPVQAQWIGKPDIRYWTARPSEEQRKAEPWKDGEQDG